MTDTHYVRAPGTAHACSGQHCLLLRPGRPPLQISHQQAPHIASLFARLWKPQLRSELLETVDASTLQLFIEEELLIECESAELKRQVPLASAGGAPERCLVLGVSGASASAFLAPQVRQLQEQFATRIELVVSRGAQYFLNTNIFAHMGIKVWTSDFVRTDEASVPHMHLARAADLVLVMPASARTVARLAHGACSDLLSLTVCATRAPVVVAPSMNEQMYWHPAVQRNLAQLQQDGVFVVGPGVSRALVDGRAGPPALGALGAVDAALVELLEAVLAVHSQRSEHADAEARGAA